MKNLFNLIRNCFFFLLLLKTSIYPGESKLYAQTRTSDQHEMQAYLTWRNELDQAVRMKRNNDVMFYLIGGAGLVGTMVYMNASQPSINGYVVWGIVLGTGFIMTQPRKAARVASSRIQQLNRYGQERRWTLGPPVPSGSGYTEEKENNEMSITERLEALRKLRDNGLISEEEYEAARKELIRELF